MSKFDTYQKVHGNKKVKIGKNKYRVNQLKNMTEDELKQLYNEVEELIGADLEVLWMKYSENLLLKEAGKLYGSDLLQKNNDNLNGPQI